MKRLLLILTVYVLASIEVQAQVVGEEDSIKVIWEDKQEWVVYKTPIYKAFEGNFLINTKHRLQYDPYIKKDTVVHNHLQKRNIETGEVVQEVEVSNPESFTTLYVSQIADLLAYKKANSLKVIFCNQSNFDSLFTIEVSESILKYQAKKYDLELQEINAIESFAVSPDDKTLILSLRIPNDIIKTKYIYDIESRQLVDSLFTEYEYTRSMLFTPDNKKFVTESIENINGSNTFYIKIYDTKDFSLIKKVPVDHKYYRIESNTNSNKIMLFTSNDNYSLIIDLIDYSIKKIQVDYNYAIYGYITKNEKYMLISNAKQGNHYFYIYNLETDQIERTFDFLKAN
jgi:WD40 repeat protein